MGILELLTGRTGKIDSALHSVSLSDVRRPDAPLIYVNQGFENLTGYTKQEVVGRNCRFLQGIDTDRDAVRQVREAVHAGAPLLIDLLNYRKDGSRFWNRLSLRPVRTPGGELTHIIGIQSDLTRLKETEEQLYALALELAAIAPDS